MNTHPELVETLAEGIAKLTSSEDWQRYLDFQSRFHRYSFGNALLIAAQYREATQVAGYNAWRKMHRFVRKGEKAIFILAPMVYKHARAEEGEDDRVIRGFKFVPVFDVSQTDGEELPSVCTRLDGQGPAGHYATLLAVAQSIGFTVEEHEFDGATNGDCTHGEHRIRVEARNAPAQRVKTLAHEIAHALLHETVESRSLAELEAESTAYVVCRALGIDSGEYSFVVSGFLHPHIRRSRGGRRDQGVLRAHPEGGSDDPAGLRACWTRGGGLRRPSSAPSATHEALSRGASGTTGLCPTIT